MGSDSAFGEPYYGDALRQDNEQKWSALAAARREAEEALAEYDRLWGAAHATNAYGRAVVGLASALRALLAEGPEAPPPPSAAVREAAEGVVRGDWWGHYCPSCGSTAKHGPECRIGRLAKSLSSARAAKGGAE